MAYSGGVDSAYLAWAAYQTHGAKMLAILADSPSLARKQLADAVQFADEHGFPLKVVATSEMMRPEYVRNDSQRCFFCKDELFHAMEALRTSMGDVTLVYGMNADDHSDYRPGQNAAVLHHAGAPLATAGLTKMDVRKLARIAGLRVWDKPASACLASRLEYGLPVTAEALRQVEQAEDYLHGLGFRQLRVRHHGKIARVEIARNELASAFSLAMLDRITSGVRAAGFEYVTLDCEGYCSGSMNAILPTETLYSIAALETADR